MQKISIIGLGKLGLPLLLVFASKGFRTFGFDTNQATMHKLQSGICPLQENQIKDLLEKYHSNISFTENIKNIVEESDISFIVVPTPSNADGSFSSTYVEEALKSFLPFVRLKQKKHTFVITSTISPGTMENRIKPLIEQETHKKIGEEIGLCYSPELIALGTVIQNLTHPDLIFIGESDKKTGNSIASIRKKICMNKPKVILTNWINAELIKLALNAYITTKISFANMIARISERIPGADSEIILGAIGQDSRVGTKYLKSGLGYGGPCFPRDNMSLYSTIKKIGMDINLPLMIDQFNKEQTTYLYKRICPYLKRGSVVGILGLSYKPDTDVIDDSSGVLLALKLIENKTSLVVYDPQAQGNAIKILKTAQFTKNEHECIQQSDIIVITTPWNQFKDIRWEEYKGKTIIDCWRLVNTQKQKNSKNKLIQLGTYIS